MQYNNRFLKCAFQNAASLNLLKKKKGTGGGGVDEKNEKHFQALLYIRRLEQIQEKIMVGIKKQFCSALKNTSSYFKTFIQLSRSVRQRQRLHLEELCKQVKPCRALKKLEIALSSNLKNKHFMF